MLNEWEFWACLLGGIVVLALLAMLIFGDDDEKRRAKNTITGLCVLVGTVVASTIVMTYAIKPALNWVWNLLF